MKKRLLLLLSLLLLLTGCQMPWQKSKEPKVSLYLTKTGEKKELLLEDYLAGVVAGEMLPNWPKEAYAAQAILARTFTMEFINRGGVREKYGTDLSDDITETQAYNPDGVSQVILDAVKETRGMVVTYNKEYIKAWFHAFSGGETTTANTGLNYQKREPPYIKVVQDPGIDYAPPEDRSWSASYSFEEITKLLGAVGLSNFPVQNVEISKKNDQGRATEFTVSGNGNSQVIPGAEFRIALDSTRLKSIWIDSIQRNDTGVVFLGKGYGHGVGMSQWGAYALAEQGKKAEDIVRYFFEGVEITKSYR
ncbi:MAG TPA: SpoIID/LytB domain-containing protein [Firmicutes bacterium]|jgi:stage II sporulation protein D|nr:SpoIID/LytB domain-containing protein [Bacillota bacterium]